MGFLDRILSSTTKLHSGVANTPDTRLFEPQELAHLPGRLVTSTGPAATQTSNVCEHCGRRLEMGIDHNELVCSECGIASRSVACDDEETRTFADDDQETKDKKKRTESDKRDLQHELCTFDNRAISDDGIRRIATNRLNQTLVWLRWLRGPGVPGELALNSDEADTFTLVARMACLQWAKESKRGTEDGEGADRHFGSPVFWAIAIALGVVARRECGFQVQTQAMAQRFTMVRLHERLSDYKSYAVITSEQIGYRTTVHGAAATGAKATDDKTRRKARFDPLGDEKARRAKLQMLNGLVKRSRVFDKQGDDPYVIGLAQAVLLDKPPSLMVAYARKGFVCSRLALVESKPVRPEDFASTASWVLTKGALVAHDADADANASEPGPGSCSTAPAKRVIAASEADSDDLPSLVASDDDEALIVAEGEEDCDMWESAPEQEQEHEGALPAGLGLEGEVGHAPAPKTRHTDEEIDEILARGATEELLEADLAQREIPSELKPARAIPQEKLKKATTRQFINSSNYKKPGGWAEWRKAVDEWEASQEYKEEERQTREREECEAREARESAKVAREAERVADLAHSIEGKQLDHDIRKQEEDRKRARLGGAVVRRDVKADHEAGGILKLTIQTFHKPLRIKVGGAKLQAVKRKLEQMQMQHGGAGAAGSGPAAASGPGDAEGDAEATRAATAAAREARAARRAA